MYSYCDDCIARQRPDVRTTFCRLMGSIIEQTHGNVESICVR